MTDYVASPRTEDPAELLRERDIQVRFLLDECDRLEAAIAAREEAIQELMIDLADAERRAAQQPHQPAPDSAPTGHAGRNTGVLKPCLGCGTPTEASRCADCRLPRAQAAGRPSATQRGYDSRWQALSRRLRKQSPFCELSGCGNTTNLVVDHIIPLSEDPTLRLEPLNCRVTCRACNSRRHNHCTDDERRMVRDAIAARKRRRTAI